MGLAARSDWDKNTDGCHLHRYIARVSATETTVCRNNGLFCQTWTHSGPEKSHHSY